MDSIGEKRGAGKSGVGVLDKAVGILSLLAEGGPATLAGVVRGTGLARPTAYRLLTALEAHGLVARGGGRGGRAGASGGVQAVGGAGGARFGGAGGRPLRARAAALELGGRGLRVGP